MDRNKIIAISVGGLALLAAVTFGLQGANAATWHDYKGDVYAGHAYGLVVPPNAKSYEVTLAGSENATAKLAMFDPTGAKLGYYELSHDLTAASVATPAQGRHVLYVYDITGDGALTLRVDSDTAPRADLQEIPLARADVSIASQSDAAKLDKVITEKLDAAPVFATLLYDGSAQDLNAQVATTKGDVVTITHETGTAFSPGVWTSQSGTRTSNPANLDGSAYTITVHAAKFQGDMVLTTLALDLKAPTPTPTTAKAPAPNTTATVTPIVKEGSFALTQHHAVAFQATAGKLLLEDPRASSSNASRHNDSDYSYVNDIISVYTPDDAVLAVVTLDSQHPTASVDLPADGEYVAYAVSVSNKAVLAHLDGVTTAPAVRDLPLQKESIALTGGSEQKFTLKRAPVELQLRQMSDLSLFGSAVLSNAKGHVAEINDLAAVGQGGIFTYMSVNRTNFAAGEHVFKTSSLLGDERYQLTAVYYDRALPKAPAPAAAPAPSEPSGEPASPDAPPAPPTPDAPPVPASAPAPAPAPVPLAKAVLGLLG